MSVVTHVAVVGGGSVAVSFTHQLVLACIRDTPREALSILLYEPAAQPGPGGAYQDDLPSNLLNIPAGNMSALADDRGHFVAWLQAQDKDMLAAYGVHTIDSGAFFPRPLFGIYLSHVYAQTCALARTHGITLTHIRAAVTRLTPLPDGRVRVESDRAPACTAQQAVLCNGNLPSLAFTEFLHSPGYFHSPYPVRELADTIDPEADVSVIGSSLSAVDAVVALQSAGHRGRIVCLSRNGRLPSVRSLHNRPVSLQHLTRPDVAQLATRQGGKLTLEAVHDALRTELATLGDAIDLQDILGGSGNAAEVLEEEISRSQAGPRPWQAVAAATNGVIDLIWHLLAPAEKARFQSQWRTLWMARRATFPMANALKLQALLKTGQLEVHGGYAGSTVDRNQGRYRSIFKHAGEPSHIESHYLINATSFSVDASRSEDPLVKNLLADDCGGADPLGGFSLDFETGCLKTAAGDKRESISVLGSLAAGTYFWTTSMDVNARLANDQAKRIAAALCPQGVALTSPETRADVPSLVKWPAHTPPRPAPVASS